MKPTHIVSFIVGFTKKTSCASTLHDRDSGWGRYHDLGGMGPNLVFRYRSVPMNISCIEQRKGTPVEQRKDERKHHEPPELLPDQVPKSKSVVPQVVPHVFWGVPAGGKVCAAAAKPGL